MADAGRWTTTHPFVVDVLFAALVGVLAMIGHLTAEVTGSQRDPDVYGVLLVVGQTCSFVFRRRAPLRSLVAVVALTMVFWVADYPSNFEVFSLLSVYAATAHGGPDRRRVWIVAGTVVALLTTVGFLGVIYPDEDLPPAAVFAIAAIHLTAAAVGEVVHDRRRRMALLEERAVRAEAERELLAREAVLAERGRIARDLHDIVAHAMSMMVVQAGAAERVVDAQPDRARQALGDIQSTGRAALGEMRRMVGVLRDGADPELAPQPTMDDLGTVVQHCNEAGVPTELVVDGEPIRRTPGIEMTGYRVVQEALTNVVKHAGRPAHAAVRITHRPDHVGLEVVDDGRGTTIDLLATSTGHGLVGMRERVEMYQGSFHAGPRPGGGFRVAATIPVAHLSGAASAVERETA
jgi:signal transduction histidine kinase